MALFMASFSFNRMVMLPSFVFISKKRKDWKRREIIKYEAPQEVEPWSSFFRSLEKLPKSTNDGRGWDTRTCLLCFYSLKEKRLKKAGNHEVWCPTKSWAFIAFDQIFRKTIPNHKDGRGWDTRHISFVFILEKRKDWKRQEIMKYDASQEVEPWSPFVRSLEKLSQSTNDGRVGRWEQVSFVFILEKRKDWKRREIMKYDAPQHGLRTPNEGINQRYLKNWADVADKICCRHT